MCRKIQWLPETAIEESNYYSTATQIIAPAIDLMDFYIKDTMSEIEYKFENVETDFSLYLSSSNFSFQLTNMKEVTTEFFLQDYFGVYQYEQRKKYLIDVYDNSNNWIYRGFIYQGGVDFHDRRQETLDVLVIGSEKEFKGYYANKSLQNMTFVNSLFGLTGFGHNGISQALDANFTSDNLTIDLASELSTFLMSAVPYFYAPASSFQPFNNMFFKTGYYSFYRDGCSIYDWLNSLTIPMGWLWGFYLDKLFIKQRDGTSYPEYVLDYNTTFMKHDIDNELSDLSIDNIMIDEGQFYSNRTLLTPATSFGRSQYVGGNRKRIYSEKNYFNTRVLPYRFIGLIATTYAIFYQNKTMIYLDEQGKDSRFKEYSIYQPSPNITSRNSNYAHNNTLRLSPYIVSTDNAGGLDITQARTTGSYIDIGNGNFFTTNIALGNNDFRYTGHAANSLFKYNSTSGKYETYDNYVETDAFKNNFRKFLRTDQQILFTVDVKGLITNPLITPKIINYPYYELNNRSFSLQGLKFHPIKETSQLKLLLNA